MLRSCASSSMRRPPLQRPVHRPQPFLARTLGLVSGHHAAAAAPWTTTTAAAPQVLIRRLSSSPRPLQYQEPHRYYFASPPPPPPPPPSRRPRRRWLRISAVFFLLCGMSAALVVREYLIPSPPSESGTTMDLLDRMKIRPRALRLPLVQSLLNDPEWTHHEAYSSIPDASRPGRLTTGPLGGSAHLGAYQHVFHHHPARPTSDPSEVISVVYFGDATYGWPHYVHGGLLATVLDEHSARAAAADPALRARDLGVLTARLDIQYRTATRGRRFYVVRARALRDDELEPRERGKRDRKIWVDVVLESPEGHEHVRARALFVIPKGKQLRGIPEGF